MRATSYVYAMLRPTENVIDVEQYAVADEGIQDARAARRTPAAMLAAAFRTDAAAFATLSRYEATLDARLAHALAELDRLQAARAVPLVSSARMALAAKRTHG